METLARFRPDQKLKEELAAIQGEDDFQPIGYIAADWFDDRYIGRASVDGRYADLYTRLNGFTAAPAAAASMH